MSSKTAHSYEFANFRLDPSEKILFCDDKPLPLTPKVFETLQVFVENAGRLLEKDELMQKIWQGRFVEESNLTFNVKVLRRVLNDDAHQPRFIETVPRRGYRFIAEVKEAFNTAARAETVQPIPISIQPASKRSYLPLAALAVLLLGAIGIAAFWSRFRQTTSVSSAPILSAPFKSENFAKSGSVLGVITPDGKYVAYTFETGGKHSIWLRQLETSENIQIVPPSDQIFTGLAISNDGNSLYFVRRAGPNSADVYRVMTFGGIPTKIVDNAQGWISVSPDDAQISFVRCNYTDVDFCSLFIADADGKNERKILTRPRPVRITDNQFSPDGKSIAFAAGQSWNGGRDFRLMLFELASSSESQISSKAFFEIKSLKWLPNAEGLLLTANEMLDGPLRIWQVSTTTTEVKALTNDATNYGNISLDKAADKMIATNISNSFHLYLAEAGDLNNAKSLAVARTFTFGNGDKIVYAGDDGDIWSINRDGGEQRQLTNNPFKDNSPRVSPDGRHVFFASARSGSSQVWRMNADGSNQIQLTNGEGGYPRFVTPDERWVYFESALNHTLWRVSTEGGEQSQVSNARVWQTAFSSDGKLAAYFFHDSDGDTSQRIAVMSVESGQVLKTYTATDDKSFPLSLAWTTDGKNLIYITASGSTSLWRKSLGDDQPHLLANLGSEEINDFALSADGNYMGFVRGQWVFGAVLIEGLK